MKHTEHTNFWLWLMRQVPRKWLYWAVIQAWVYATQKWPDKAPDAITFDEVCKMLDGRECGSDYEVESSELTIE